MPAAQSVLSPEAPFGLIGALTPWGGKGSVSYQMTTVFVKQPLQCTGFARVC